MQKKRVLLGAALLVIGGLLFFSLFQGKKREKSPSDDILVVPTNRSERVAQPVRVKDAKPIFDATDVQPAIQKVPSEELEPDPLRRAVLKWESVVDEMLKDSQTLPFTERAKVIREELAKLPESERKVGLQTLLNLLPDEKFDIVGPLLIDKNDDPELLSELFDDMLNRPAEVKNTYILAISASEGHPEQASAKHIVETTAIAEETIKDEKGEMSENE